MANSLKVRWNYFCVKVSWFSIRISSSLKCLADFFLPSYKAPIPGEKEKCLHSIFPWKHLSFHRLQARWLPSDSILRGCCNFVDCSFCCCWCYAVAIVRVHGSGTISSFCILSKMSTTHRSCMLSSYSALILSVFKFCVYVCVFHILFEHFSSWS